MIFLESKYRWPMVLNIYLFIDFTIYFHKTNKKWFLKKIIKTVKYPMKYFPGCSVGFEEIVNSSTPTRKETLEVEEDCILLELNRSKFFESNSF